MSVPLKLPEKENGSDGEDTENSDILSKSSAESPIDNILEDPTFVGDDLSDSDNATPRVTRSTRNSLAHNQEPLDTR